MQTYCVCPFNETQGDTYLGGKGATAKGYFSNMATPDLILINKFKSGTAKTVYYLAINYYTHLLSLVQYYPMYNFYV